MLAAHLQLLIFGEKCVHKELNPALHVRKASSHHSAIFLLGTTAHFEMHVL